MIAGRAFRIVFALIAGPLAGVIASGPAIAQSLPIIRTSATNRVPACATPDRLMAFVAERNPRLLPKYAGVAEAYREVGLAYGVRWDYAFFQMILETNYLQFRRGDGSSGDVSAGQNNFAGIGATGGGVPGDRYADVRTGVLAHIQHLVAYSGEIVDRPVAQRTREHQKDIAEISRRLNRPVTFADLSRRWAVDRAYGRNIETVAQLFRRGHCTGGDLEAAAKPAVTGHPVPLALPAQAAAAASNQGGSDGMVTTAAAVVPMMPKRCRVYQASYGGAGGVLIRSLGQDEVRFTALTVAEEHRDGMAKDFLAKHVSQGQILGHYKSSEAAIAAARTLCPSGS